MKQILQNLKTDPQITQIIADQKMRDQRTYKIIGAAIEVQSADYADYAEMKDQRTYPQITQNKKDTSRKGVKLATPEEQTMHSTGQADPPQYDLPDPRGKQRFFWEY